MKYLKNFANAQEAEDYIDNFDGNYNFLASVEGFPGVGIIHGGSITVNGLTFVFDSLGTTPGTYTYDYDATMTINDYLYEISEDHPELNKGWDVYNAPSAPRHAVEHGTPIGELGINEGDTLYCYEIFN